MTETEQRSEIEELRKKHARTLYVITAVCVVAFLLGRSREAIKSLPGRVQAFMQHDSTIELKDLDLKELKLDTKGPLDEREKEALRNFADWLKREVDK